MEKAFDLVGVEGEQKCKFASYYLKSEANYWWESVEPLEEVEIVSWDRFKELFLEKYFPKYMQSQMELKFFELRQENSSVMEYERKFTELARFVPEYVNTDEKRAKRFQQGLRPWIRSKVAVFELSTYAAVVQKAMIIEGESEQYNKERDSKKRKAESHGGSSGQGSSQGQFNKRPGFQQGKNTGFRKPEGGQGKQSNPQQNVNQQRQQRPPVPDCKTCGKKHSGVCNKSAIVCFKCNQKGHYANECKNQRAPILCNRCGKPGHISKNCRTGMPAATNNLKFVNKNFAAILDKPSAPEPFHKVQDFLKSSSIGYALVQPESISTSAVILIWSTAEVQEDSIKFTYADKEYVITPEVVRQALQLPEITSYAPSYPDDEIKIFIESLGYNGDTSKLGKLVRAKLRKEWNFYFDCITKCFTNKSSNFDALTQTAQQIGYCLFKNTDFDFASLILEYISMRITDKRQVIYFSRFLHLIFVHLIPDAVLQNEICIKVHKNGPRSFVDMTNKDVKNKFNTPIVYPQ